MIYFVQAGSSHGPIKIGYVESPGMIYQRLRFLQTGNAEALFIVTSLPGGLEREREFHDQFAEGCIRGEWFRWDAPGLQELIAKGVEAEALQLNAGLRYCSWCKRQLVFPPRTRLCSAKCEREKKLDAARKWKAARRSRPEIPARQIAEGPDPA